MHDILIDILVFVVTLISIVITGTVIPYIKSLIKDSEYAWIYDIVETAVKAAEQTYNAPKQGKAKKAEVISYVSRWLEARGITLTEDDLNRLIEAAVFSMNNEG